MNQLPSNLRVRGESENEKQQREFASMYCIWCMGKFTPLLRPRFFCRTGCGAAACSTECYRGFLTRVRDHTETCTFIAKTIGEMTKIRLNIGPSYGRIKATRNPLSVMKSAFNGATTILNVDRERPQAKLVTWEALMVELLACDVAEMIDDSLCATSLYAMSLTLFQCGMYGDSANTSRAAAILEAKATPIISERMALCLYQCGRALEKMNNFKDCFDVYVSALPFLKRYNNTDLINEVLARIAAIKTTSNEFALQYTKDELLEMPAKDSSERASKLLALGVLQHRAGKHDDAILTLCDCLQMRARIYGSGSEASYMPLYTIGLAFKDKGDCREALSFLEQARQICLRVHGEKSEMLQECDASIAVCHAQLSKPAEVV
jgi:tetratricopeptide (TPR) repeat protein